jgi:hypothetical protein
MYILNAYGQLRKFKQHSKRFVEAEKMKPIRMPKMSSLANMDEH